MTVTINGYKVTANKETLNYISMLANEASRRYGEENYNGLSEEAYSFSKVIFDKLNATGYYN